MAAPPPPLVFSIVGGAGADSLAALAGGSTIGGLGGDDTLAGLGGADALAGGGGSDSLAGGLGHDTLWGEDGDDTLAGGGGHDVLVSGMGADSVFGGDGDDTIWGLAGPGAATLAGGNGADVISGGGRLLGGTGSDSLAGDTGADTLDGGAGADTMAGGAGDDVYLVDHAGDRVTEAPGGGIDLVRSSVSFSLAGLQVEHLTLIGAGTIDGTGNALDNRITGNAAPNRLLGGGGADTLDGGAGADTMEGGTGDDVHIVDDAGDRVIEGPGGGIDLVRSSVTFSLAGQQIENLTLTGAAAIEGAGNGLANHIVGNAAANRLRGLGGDDRLDGGAGADTMEGGPGNDTYVVDNAGDLVVETAGNGTDLVQALVSHALGAHVEQLELIGTAPITGTGNALDNWIAGNGAANRLFGLDGNDTLDGRGGADTMEGGNGHDAYLVDHLLDLVIEAPGAGTDIVYAFVSHTLAAQVENLALLGAESIAGTGNALGNSISGNGAANRLRGLGGDDTLAGGLGPDTLEGGNGNDLYVVEDATDRVIEAAGAGADTVLAHVGHTLATQVEALLLIGAGPIDGAGNALDNLVIGNGAANLLQGLAGNDSLFGGDGADTLDGGAGADTMEGGAGGDTHVVDNPGDVVIETALGGTDTVRASITHTLAAHVEHLVLTGAAAIDGTGNGLANRITGNGGANRLEGGAGNDTLSGGAGADTLDGGPGADSLSGGNGDDVLIVDVLDGDSRPDGTPHHDTVAGGAGNDVYLLHVEVLHGAPPPGWLIEAADGGADTLVATAADVIVLPDHVEHLAYQSMGDNVGGVAFGNALDNVIGGSGPVELALLGGAGNDTVTSVGGWASLYGEDGNDLLTAIDHKGRALLSGGAGNDTLTVSAPLLAETLEGGEGDDSLVGGADTFHGWLNMDDHDLLLGGNGNDTLVGGIGHDTLDGGEGDDSLRGGADSLSGDGQFSDHDSLIGGNGRDTLLGGWGNDTILGGAGDDSIDGHTGANLLDGGDGADTIRGTQGADTMIADGAGTPARDHMSVHFTGTFVSRGGGDTVIGGISEGAIDQLTLDLSWRASALSFTLADPLATTTLSGDAGTNVTRIERFDITGGAGADLLLLDTAGVIGVADTLRGGEGADTLGGGAGHDSLAGGGGSDSLLGGSGNDMLDGGNGADTLDGGTGADSLSGGAGADSLSGGDGADTLQGGAGADRMLGGNENDLLIDADSAAADTISGDAGNDTVVASGGGDSLSGGANFDLLELDLSWRNVALGFVAPTGLDAATISGDGTRVTQFELYTILAGSGHDSLAFSGFGGGTLDGGAGSDSLLGASWSDLLRGGEGADTLDGGTGGNDTLIGGNGNDVYIVQGDGLLDTLFELPGGGVDEIRSFAASFMMPIASNIERLVVATPNASGTGWGGEDVMLGSNGAQTLDGGFGNDTLSGLGGDDLLDGGFGSDSLSGGEGADTLDGSFGNDTLAGGTGDDVYLWSFESGGLIVEAPGGGIDEVRSSAATFTLEGTHVERLVVLSWDSRGNGSSGGDTILGEAGAQTLDGRGGSDSLVGLAGNDVLIGGDGADTLEGGEDADLLSGGADADLLLGGAGPDTLEGEAGADTLEGGGGSDAFRFASQGLGTDLVAGFDTGFDRIEVRSAGFGHLLAFDLVVQQGTAVWFFAPVFILDTSDHTLWFDIDGAGGAAPDPLLRFSAPTALAVTDFAFF